MPIDVHLQLNIKITEENPKHRSHRMLLSTALTLPCLFEILKYSGFPSMLIELQRRNHYLYSSRFLWYSKGSFPDNSNLWWSFSFPPSLIWNEFNYILWISADHSPVSLKTSTPSSCHRHTDSRCMAKSVHQGLAIKACCSPSLGNWHLF